MQLPHLFRRLRHVPLVALSALVLASGASAADSSVPPAGGGTGDPKPAKVTVKNIAAKKRRLVQIVLHKTKPEPEQFETLNVNLGIPGSGGTETIDSSTFTSTDTVSVSSTTWDVTQTLAPLPMLATVRFDDDTGGKDVIYTLMYSTHGEIVYGVNAADLAACIPVPEDQAILVSNGIDRTGHFPATVVFRDAATQLPYSGPLTSAGLKEHLAVWTHGLFGGSSGLTGSTPRLDGDGDLTSNGTISLLLSGAEPGAMAVLVAGFDEINVPFAGTTLGPAPRFVLPGLLVGEWGNNELTFTLGEMPKGIELYAQEFIVGAAGAGPVATNTLIGHSF